MDAVMSLFTSFGTTLLFLKLLLVVLGSPQLATPHAKVWKEPSSKGSGG